ncbi:inosine/xanthosine triphosphatase [Paraglaciecola hydrolytica]|uniref:Inosine/xanthosine triphosphatase n=1 Tax=Paraglaciecola hydrolytica TaxID=1799789 RepID=A0A136A374_9ALTE|nr:inosine/xanthosine triphosphatase [Paraglaciecola hydrolytica]KXI29686.1 xanthosine triphosphate pyrophosphatase [Paraglaciecola hydrolytica]
MNNAPLKLVVASLNPVKVNAAKQAFTQVFAINDVACVTVDAPSGVAEQPMSAEATRLGAINRLKYCQQYYQADYYVAIEGGVDMTQDGPVTFAYVVIANNQHMSIGRSATLPLPLKVYRALQQGAELGPLMDSLFNTVNIKQRGGAIGLLTRGQANREGNYTQALILALAPFLHPDLYAQDE